MSEFPSGVEAALRNGTFLRATPGSVLVAFERLEVCPSGLFLRFFETFTGGYQSERCGYLLLDPVEGVPTIVEQTMAARDSHGFPSRYLVISEMEGGAVLVYDCGSDAVLEVDFEGGDRMLMAGTLSPRWSTFEGFLAAFFS